MSYCDIDMCERPRMARGLCAAHYRRLQRTGIRGGEIAPVRRGGETVCLVEDCETEVHCRGWCMKHYTRWRRTGDPLGSRPRRPPAPRPLKTHCKYGHELTGDNVRIRRSGTARVCRTCVREQRRRRKGLL